MKYLPLIIILFVLNGCASTRVINKIPEPQTQEQSIIKICRQKIFYGDAAATIISLDRRPILRSAAGKCFSARTTSGPHVIGVMIQGPAGPDISEYEFILPSNTTLYFKTRYEEIHESTAAEFEAFSNYEQIIIQ